VKLPAALQARVRDTMKGKASPMPREHARSKLEQEWERRWALLSGPALAAEYRFHPVRLWRLDFAHIESRVGIELHGGTWVKGRHTRGGGFAADREKINAAQLQGWLVLEFCAATWEAIRQAMDAIAKRMEAQR